MSSSNGPNTIKSGLVLELDSGNTKSYQSGSTLWYDKSGNNNKGTLLNGVAYTSSNGGSLVFDGVDDYVNITYNANPFNIGTNDFTFNVWYNPSIDGPYLRVFDIGQFASAGNFQFERQNNAAVAIHINGSYNGYSSYNPSGVWQNYQVVRQSGTVTVYQNTVNVGSNLQNGAINNTSDINIGRDPAYGVYFGGKIPIISLYNRALTTLEVLQNYNALKSRFGLA